MDCEIDWILIVRYLSGDASIDEQDEVERWLEAQPELRRWLDEAQTVWNLPQLFPDRSEVDSTRAFARLEERIGDAEVDVQTPPLQLLRPVTPAPHRPKRRGTDRSVLRAVAAVLVVVGGGALWFGLGRDAGTRIGSVEVRRFETGPGQRIQVRLPDGSTVMVGPQSTLAVPERFSGESRDVSLEGIAYFKVERDVDHPFIVRTPASVTRVLGTAFALRAYPHENQVQIAVEEGKVALSAAQLPSGASTLVTPGQLATLLVDRAEISVASVDLHAPLGWTRGWLWIENAPLAQVATEIEGWYGVDLELSDSILSQRSVTLRLLHPSLEDALDMLDMLLDIRHERRGGTIVLTPAKSP